MLKKGIIDKLVWSILVFGIVMPLATGQTTVARTALSAHRVADAMELAGVVVNPDQIEFLSGKSNLEENTTLRVLSVTHSPAGDSKVKLRCRDNRECLPFYVLVHGLDRMNLDGPQVHTVPAMPAVAASSTSVVRGGDRATLILESSDSRMNLPVICLQSGVRGQTIRVASLDHRQFFDAEIVSTGMLKGSL
jgi:hypothetical protein